MSDATFLGQVLRTIEGVLIGDAGRGFADPALGLTLSTGLFLGRPLREADFLADKRVAVHRVRTANTDTTRNARDAMVADSIVVELSYHLPPPVDGAAVDTDQRDARDAAYVLDTKMRGLILNASGDESQGFALAYVETTERGTLNPHPRGYGEYEFLVLSSVYRARRIESLTGGAET